MQNIFSYLNSILEVYWGQSKFQLLLCIAILIILLLEKETWKKITFGWYAIVCFIGLLNPITVKITSKIWGESVAYYCRQFSLVPTFLIIAYGVGLLYKKICGKKKVVIFLALLLTICVNGNNMYQETWYTKADNYEKIPNDIIQIGDFFENLNENVRVATTTGVGSYLRQYANVLQMQGRGCGYENFEIWLQDSEPNALNIISEAGQIGCDYVVAIKNNNSEKYYNEAGFYSCFETDNYMIYKVENVKRWKNRYDEKNRIVDTVYLDEDGNVTKTDKGYSEIKYTYDNYGNKLNEYFFDENLNPTPAEIGQYGTICTYDCIGRLVQVTYVDGEGESADTVYGYSVIKYYYDKNGDRQEEGYYKSNGERVK